MVSGAIARVQTIDGLWALPEGWEWVPLEVLCSDIVGGGTPKRARDEYYGGDILWVTPSDLDANDPCREIFSSRNKLTPLGLKSSSAKLVPAETILFSSRATIGKIAIAGVPLCTNQGFANLICSDLLDNHYLAWCLYTLTDEIKKLAGSTTYLEVSRGNLRRFKIPFPFPSSTTRSLETQRRLATRIEALMAEVKRARTIIEQMRNDAARLIHAALREVFPRSEKALPQGWQLRTIEDIKPSDRSPVQTGPFGAQLKSDEFVGTGIPVVAIGNVQWGKLDTNQLNYVTPVKAKQLSRYKLQAGDILFTRMGTVGRSCVVPTFADGWLMTYHLIRVSVNPEKAIPEFVAYCFHGANIVEDQIREKGRGATREGVNSQILRELRLPLPQLTQQKQIVAYLNSIQSGIHEMQHRLDQKDKLIDQLEQSILARAFRGKL